MNLREKRAFQIAENLDNASVEEHLKEYHSLLDTLMYLNETLAESKAPIGHWLKFSETLLIKFMLHGLTIHQIFSGLKLKSNFYDKEISGRTIIDISSGKVILRSQLETFLMYHHIYVNPKTNDEKEFRYYAWMITGLLNRQSFPTTTPYAEEQKKTDQGEIERFKEKITSLPAFKRLNERQKKSLLSTGSSKLFSHWGSILKETGFNEKHAMSLLYYHWSTYSHSEGISALQLVGRSLNPGSVKDDIIYDLHSSKILVCLMIKSISTLFKIVEIKYNVLPEATRMDVELYNVLSAMAVNNL